MRVVTSSEMKEIEKRSFEEFGFSEAMVIENVGLRGADYISGQFLEEDSFSEIVVMVGRGNNGADGLAIARHLANRGGEVRAFCMFDESECSQELLVQKKLAFEFGVKINEIRDVESLQDYFTQSGGHYLVIDAILGMGFRLPLSNYLFDAVGTINEHAAVVVAIDLPTGVTADHGETGGAAIEATMTLAIGLPKTGHYVDDGAQHSGMVAVLDAGFPVQLLEGGDTALLTHEGITNIYRPRNKFAHKNTFGHCLVVGGSQGLTGALMMASQSALKVGTGLVTASTWEENYAELASRSIPEIMTGTVPTEPVDVKETIRALGRYDAIVVGPGMSRTDRTRNAVIDVLDNFYGPVIIDADAIRALSLEKDLELLRTRRGQTIFTPHIGEFAAFAGLSTAEVLKDPIGKLKEMVDKTNSCIILKGACTYLGFPTGEVFINYYPNDGMASGGSGDVLAGMIGGLAAQNAPDPSKSGIFQGAEQGKFFQSICLAVAAHTLAGKFAADKLGERSMTATSIIDHLPDAFREMGGHE
ncbi:MAG: hypothetical protein CME71_12460 [Halobacteriovorax sp.]|nr:hypothetical protein [Halobacteriovorax sp.]